MRTHINGKKFESSLSDKLQSGSTYMKDAGNIVAYSACVLSSEPLSLLQLIPIVLKATGSAITSAVRILKGFSNPNSKISKVVRAPEEKFPLLFYLFIQQSYLEALKENLEKIDESEIGDKDVLIRKLKKDDFRRYKEVIEPSVEGIVESEIQFCFCIDPISKEIPLFSEYSRWLRICFESHGARERWQKYFVESVKALAHQKLHLKISSGETNAKWIRDYLVLEYAGVVPRISNDLSLIKQSLQNWTDSLKKIKEKQKNAWGRYREILKGLPDDKDTMYNESFGVRDVFVTPQVKYHIAGIEGSLGRPQDVSDISHLVGALVSNRTSGEDLIILCGGPGSGKSTLCRMIASELVENQDLHPVFLKLRRCKEGSDICSFVSDSLSKLGVINEISDLHSVPNLILILDGFDELVMASRQRLRLFFNHLQDDLRTGPFRNAKAIISGRDTLFPGGQGLPRESHILTLLPFCKKRVTHWGKKWNKKNIIRKDDPFRPDVFFEEDLDKAKLSALHHLVAWPLTLHLVAQVHAAGHLDTTEKSKEDIKKTYLYRGIMAETARRQEEKGLGKYQLDRKKIREYLRALAWEMYIRAVDSLDVDDAIPIIEDFFPNAKPDDLQMISDTNVLNAPEIQKREETGFEFVHKSFSEYLVAERFAAILEDVSYKVPERTTGNKVWHMSSDDVIQRLTGVFGLRIFPPEIQEMLEPMIGCFECFLEKTHVKDIVPSAKRVDGLNRIIQRFNEIYEDMLKGTALRRTQDATEGKLLIESPLEAYANYAAGICIMAAAAVKQFNQLKGNKAKIYFQGNPFEGAFWKFIWILQAGGVRLDETISRRLFVGMTTSNESNHETIGDWHFPLSLSSLSFVDGYQSNIREAISTIVERYNLSILVELAKVFLPHFEETKRYLTSGKLLNIKYALDDLEFREPVFKKVKTYFQDKIKTNVSHFEHLWPKHQFDSFIDADEPREMQFINYRSLSSFDFDFDFDVRPVKIDELIHSLTKAGYISGELRHLIKIRNGAYLQLIRQIEPLSSKLGLFRKDIDQVEHIAICKKMADSFFANATKLILLGKDQAKALKREYNKTLKKYSSRLKNKK